MTERAGGSARTVSEMMDSTLESVDRAEQLAVEVARESGFDEDDLHWIGMSVRECMVNAVVHGNRYNANKKVEFSVTRTREQYTVRIADQGEGFDLSELPDPLDGNNLLRSSGRGIFLVRSFMDHLVIRRRQPAGTEVILVKNVGAPAGN